MNKKREKIINAILVVVYILTIAIILFLSKSNIFKKGNNDTKDEPVIPNSGYEVVEVEDLDKKLDKLSFTNKKQDYFNKGNIVINTVISGGKVNISIKNDKVKAKYDVEGIEKAIGIATNAYKGFHISYILTEDGHVFKIEDDLSLVKADYKGTTKDLGLTNVTNIGIDKTLKFKINNELETIAPCVYIKTDDNRVFTDEKIIEGKDIVELAPKKVETTESTSES